jgi:cytochrome c-type biogenesis protein CcsB
MSVAIFLAFAFKYDFWFIGGWVQMLAAIAFGYAATWNEGYMPPVPALQSYWIKIHVPLVISAYASFLVAFVVSAIYLVKYYFERRFGAGGRAVARTATAGGPPFDVTLFGRIGDTPNIARAAAAGDPLGLWLMTLPPLAKLDIMAYRIIAVGLPLLTVGIATGAWWAKEAWGAYWQWDPKETAALVSWIVYASYMHLHTRNAWRGMRTAWVSVLGFGTIMFCYLGVNIWISGLHSYKM